MLFQHFHNGIYQMHLFGILSAPDAKHRNFRNQVKRLIEYMFSLHVNGTSESGRPFLVQLLWNRAENREGASHSDGLSRHQLCRNLFCKIHGIDIQPSPGCESICRKLPVQIRRRSNDRMRSQKLC